MAWPKPLPTEFGIHHRLCELRGGEIYLVLYPEEEGFQDEGHNNGHDDHGDDVESHEKNPGPVVGDTGVTLHDNEPIVDHCQLKKGYTRCRHVVEIVQPVVRVLS